MENKLFLVGIKCPLDKLADEVGLVSTLTAEEHLAYFSFWDNVCIITYDQDNHIWGIQEDIIGKSPLVTFNKEPSLFNYMDENGISFVYDNPLGEIFRSYTRAYLEIVRWAADIAYIRNYLNSLMED